jgi:aminopeptidase N
LKSTDFLALVREKMPLEENLKLVDAELSHATATLGRYVPESKRKDEFHTFFLAAWDALHRAPAGDAQIIWARAVIGTANTPEDIELTGRLADGLESVAGLTVDQEMRWGIAAKHMAYALPGAQERVADEAKRDPSDRGQRAQLRAETSVPDPAVKAAAWERFNGEGYGSLYLTAAAMAGFNWTDQRSILEPYVERFFVTVPDIFRTRDKEFASDYFTALFPGYRVEQALLDRSERLLGEAGNELPNLARMLREANDDLARAIRCRAFAEI